MKKLQTAQSAGFCFGVRRSVEMAEKLLQSGPCISFGMLIHNEDEVQRLQNLGMKTVEHTADIQPGDRVLIRAHGVPPETYRELEDRGAVISDATCPKVMLIHRIVEKAREDRRFTVIIGMKSHPEVEAIRARCGEYIILESPEEVQQWLDGHPETVQLPLSVVAQTTQIKNNFEK